MYCCASINSEDKKAIKFKTPEVCNIPNNGYLTLLSVMVMQSRDKIIEDVSFCALLVVLNMSSTSMVVCLW